MLDEREVHPHESVAQLRALRGAVGQSAQFVEHRPGAAAVVRLVGMLVIPQLVCGGRSVVLMLLLPRLLALLHVVRPLCLLRRIQPAAVVGRAHRMRPGLLPGDGGTGRHPPAAFEIFHGAPCSVMTVRDRRRAPCTD
ncbi:hypothetical protein Stsp01_27860 [Streptomyces sp. NBRC 13847]|nr:hypothetical protein Stsp01_27860 [Streptomyces sp. NBRC 13847]